MARLNRAGPNGSTFVVPRGDIAFPDRGPEVNEPGRDGWALVVIGATSGTKPPMASWSARRWTTPLMQGVAVSMGDASQAKEVGLRGVAPMERDETMLLILDLDETLVHAIEQPLSRPCDFFIEPYERLLDPRVKLPRAVASDRGGSRALLSQARNVDFGHPAQSPGHSAPAIQRPLVTLIQSAGLGARS